MPPANSPSTIESRLTRVEMAVTRLEGEMREAASSVSQLIDEFSGLKERVEIMLCKLEDHQDVLYGEHGKSGLIAQGEALEELKDALKGVGKEPGLIADIRTLTEKMARFEESRQWLTRLVLGAIIAQIIVEFFLK